jgi:UDP:flavonoid glycosyltransferase YjiC (YdhE family)
VLVVVALSTLDQGQAALLKNILVAVSDLPIQVLVTLGPALGAAEFAAPANARLERFVPHDLVLPRTTALVTQCGIGTLTKALRNGVPMICLPLVGDQHDNAVRIVGRGAGVRLPPDANPVSIRSAIIKVISDLTFKQAARMMGQAISREPDPAKRAADEIEQAALSPMTASTRASNGI